MSLFTKPDWNLIFYSVKIISLTLVSSRQHFRENLKGYEKDMKAPKTGI